MSDKSGVSAQAVTLPSGGGALKGMGETFSADLFTGTGNLAVPLGLPPGRNGLQPQLTLAYSTGSGNGPFGLGWALSLPGVCRKTAQAVPRYSDRASDPAERDTFILSGSEDLIAMSESESGVTRFRPRTEGLFARVERVQTASEDFWRVRSKDGLVSSYGASPSAGAERATIHDPALASKIYCWKLSETVDPFGNRIEYRYLRDSGADGPHSWDQLYLTTVQYGDYERDGETRFLVSVTFIHEERPDPFSEYRAGFEVRTRLRCKRIEIRTHADQERLVRTYELVYADERVRAGELPPEALPPNGVSLLSQLRVVGHDGDAVEEMPPLEFGYTPFTPEARRFQPVQAANDSLPPRSLGHPDFELVSLFGNGLPDIVQMNDVAQFWRNLGNGQFDAPQMMNEVPLGVHLSDPGVQFADMNGNGRADLLVLQQGGYFPLSFAGRWSREGFVRYPASPTVHFGDGNTRLIDLDGDGVIDALRTDTNLVPFFNDRVKGWRAGEPIPRKPLEAFPDVSFSDARVQLADMSGDGLQDIVLVEQGRIDYWPYLGHGRWGRRVTMKNSPIFRDTALGPNEFDPKRVLMGDLDGDGLADIVYVDTNRLTFWINRGGEGWSAPITIEGTPPLTDPHAVRLVDLRGTGMAGILWTFDRVSGAGSNYQFLELSGGLKPYLLAQKDNHRGAVTRIEYTSSTKFRLLDAKHPETRWKTPLPFPVQVVARVEILDALSGGKLTTEYGYHHGYWDGSEREFRGFGRVDQLDTEVFEPAGATFSPPLLTKSWFHLGPIGDEFVARSEADLSNEYWPLDPSVLPRSTDTLQLLRSLPASRRADALRSLRGQILRTEIFAQDGSERQDRPFTVTEFQYGVREESAALPSGPGRRSIFFPHLAAQRVTEWERGEEPRTTFSFADEYDPFGQSCRKVTLAVPRHRDYRVPGPAGAPYLGTLTQTGYAQRDDADRYMVDRVASTVSSEIVNDGSASALDLYAQVQASAVPLPIFGQTFNYYDGAAFAGLALQALGDFGALVRSESLVLTESILQEAFHDPEDPGAAASPPYLRPEGAIPWTLDYPPAFRASMGELAGYTFADGSDHRARGYFTQASRVALDVQLSPTGSGRGLILETRDALGNETSLGYDLPFQLLPTRVTDAAGLTTAVQHDYRLLVPRQVTDANGNRRTVTFSPLGLVTSSAVMGKEGELAGDTVNAPGARHEYDFFAFVQTGTPVSVRSIVREHHITDLDVAEPQRNAIIEKVEYSDGFGRLLQTRLQAEDVLFGDPGFGGGLLSPDQTTTGETSTGRRRSPDAPPNVIVSGLQVYDNKGRVIEKFEPFFSTGFGYAPPGDAQLGQRARLFYDPRGRVVRTVNPDGSEERVIFGVPFDLRNPDDVAPSPWETFSYDANDLAPLCEGRDGVSLAAAAPAAHHFTPANAVVDALGRIVEATARNGLGDADALRTRSTYDIRGNLLRIEDALGRSAFRYAYDFANRPLRTESIDAGVRRSVLNVLGREVESRDSKGALTLQAYDRLQRPGRLWARDDVSGSVTLRQRREYGDAGRPDQPSNERAAMRARNLLGALHRHHDEAGLTTVAAVDFKGNVLEKAHRVVADAPMLAVFANGPDDAWQITPFQMDWEPANGNDLAQLEGQWLEPVSYATRSAVDALGRIRRLELPTDVTNERQVLRTEYNRAGALEKVFLGNTVFVERIAYDAKGQRVLIAYGNGVMTRCAYDARTFRLKRLYSERYTKPDGITYKAKPGPLQDFGYEYDLVGNILAITDRTPGSGIPNNPEATLEADVVLARLLALGDALNRRFEYDPIYRLSFASGRECDRPPEGKPFLDLPRCADLSRTRAYVERYRYDAVGNVLVLEHRNGTDGFTRVFSVEEANNRLHHLQVGVDRFEYACDASGNLLSESTSRHFEWNHADQMKAFRIQTAGAEPSVHAQYLYDAGGQRLKKLVRKQGGQIEVTHYIDGLFEHHRWVVGAKSGENNHVHVMDDAQRLALVRVGLAHPDDSGPARQFHLSDHLGSSNVVVDSDGQIMNREEFTPYGESSFGSFAKKRYRFTGQERDEESGLARHGVRYYSSAMARWVSADPNGAKSGSNLFAYCAGEPCNHRDVSGRERCWNIFADDCVLDTELIGRSVGVVGGTVEVAVGCPLAETVIGAVACVDGMDNLSSSLSGQETAKARAASELLVVAGVPKPSAAYYGGWMSTIASMAISSALPIPMRAPEAYSTSSSEGAVPEPSELANLPQQGSKASEINRWFVSPRRTPAAPGDPVLAAARSELPLARNRGAAGTAAHGADGCPTNGPDYGNLGKPLGELKTKVEGDFKTRELVRQTKQVAEYHLDPRYGNVETRQSPSVAVYGKNLLIEGGYYFDGLIELLGHALVRKGTPAMTDMRVGPK